MALNGAVLFKTPFSQVYKSSLSCLCASSGTVKRDESDDSLVDYGEGGDGQFNEEIGRAHV